MPKSKTRIRLTWFAAVALTFLSCFAMAKGFEGVATTAIAGIIAVTTGYQAARSWTNTTQIKSSQNEKV